MKSILLTLMSCLALMANVEAKIETKVIHTGVNTQLVKSWHKEYNEYLIIKSSPFYQERDSSISTKGYKVDNSELVKGTHSREIYDYSNEQSSHNIYQQISESVKSSDFEVLFECSTYNCGDVQAWELYLSNLISGDKNKQYFGAAKKELKNNRFEYISYYVTEIDNQARVLFDVIMTPKNNNFDIIVESDQVSKNLLKDGRVILNRINFSVGSSLLKESSILAIKDLSIVIKNNPDKLFAVVGHTDSTGDYTSNIKLSQLRANSVVLELVNKYGIHQKQVIANGVGSLSPLTSNIDINGRSLNRRVELVQL